MEAVSWQRAAAVSGVRDGGTARLGGGPELGEKKEGGKEILSPSLPRAGTARGDGSAVAGELGG